MRSFMRSGIIPNWQSGLKPLRMSKDLNMSYNYIANRPTHQKVAYECDYFNSLCYDSIKALKTVGVAYVFQQAHVDVIKRYLEQKYIIEIVVTDGIFVVRALKRG